LSPLLQRMVDERLDGIDRALRRAGSGRAERSQIVEEVERQLWDMLPDSGEPTRRDVLGALSKLDPPEAYLPEEPPSPATRSERERRRPESDFPAQETAAVPGALPLATPATSALAIVSVCLAGLGTLALMMFLLFDLYALILGGALQLGALVCGVISGVRIHWSKGRLQGAACAATGLALSSFTLLEALVLGLALAAESEELLMFSGLPKTLIITALVVWPIKVWLTGCPATPTAHEAAA
jgi:hypothetical protein